MGDKEELKLITKINKQELQAIFDDYARHQKALPWLLFPLFAIIIVALLVYIFIAGEWFTYSEFKKLKHITFTVMGIIVFSFILILILIAKRHKVITTVINKLSSKYNLPYKELKMEFSLTLKAMLGGYGL